MQEGAGDGRSPLHRRRAKLGARIGIGHALGLLAGEAGIELKKAGAFIEGGLPVVGLGRRPERWWRWQRAIRGGGAGPIRTTDDYGRLSIRLPRARVGVL